MLDVEQRIQEEQYQFPYHYRDFLDAGQLLEAIGYLARINFAIDRVEYHKGAEVLDAGCGDGRFSYEARGRSMRVTGIDYSPQAIRFARAFNPDETFHVGDLTDLRHDQQYDAVVMVETLEHIPPAKIGAVVETVRRLLVDHGLLVVTVPSTRQPVSPKHFQHFTSSSLVETVGAGFEVVSIHGIEIRNWHWYVYAAMTRIAKLAYGLSDRIPVLEKVPGWIAGYFDRHVAHGSPDHAHHIGAVFRKVK